MLLISELRHERSQMKRSANAAGTGFCNDIHKSFALHYRTLANCYREAGSYLLVHRRSSDKMVL